jgi:hypothetical protein
MAKENLVAITLERLCCKITPQNKLVSEVFNTYRRTKKSFMMELKLCI